MKYLSIDCVKTLHLSLYDTHSFLRPVNMCYKVLLPVLSADVTNKLVKFHMNKKYCPEMDIIQMKMIPV